MQFIDDQDADLVQIITIGEKTIDDAVRFLDRAYDNVAIRKRVMRIARTSIRCDA